MHRWVRGGGELLGVGIGAARNNLGSVLRALGDLPGSRDQLERALQISEATLGPDHPQTLQIRRALDGAG